LGFYSRVKINKQEGVKGNTGKKIFLIIIIFSLLSSTIFAKEIELITTLKDVPYKLPLSRLIDKEKINLLDTVTIFIDKERLATGTYMELLKSPIKIKVKETGFHKLTIAYGTSRVEKNIHTINGLLSLLPPIIAIIFALLFKQVVIALLAGVWFGSFILTGYSPIDSVLRIVDHYVIYTLSSAEEGSSHISIIVFTLLLGGMVGITSRMGGMQGIVDKVSKIATTARRGQLAAWLMGVIVFFDDYTNTLIVGNSIRPLSDKLRISREKLSYIVDSTAAPVTALAVITSWIGFEISLLDQAFKAIGIDRNPLTTFVASIPYSFYPILAVLFVLLIIISGKDYSSMLRAEIRARKTGKVISENAVPLSSIDSEAIKTAKGITPRWYNGVIPIVTVIAIAFIGLLYTGRQALLTKGITSIRLIDTLKESDSFTALLWASSSGCIIAGVIAIIQRILPTHEIVNAWINGLKSMFNAIVILILAWIIGEVCIELHTAEFLVQNLSSTVSVRFLPLIVFIISMGISFATGTSWGTLSILIPIVIPLVVSSAQLSGIHPEAGNTILLASIAAILSGAVFGDHCSPISDTTIMSSMASASDHIDHVRTQLPYALTVGIVSIIFGYLLTAFNINPAISIAISLTVLIAILYTIGKNADLLT